MHRRTLFGVAGCTLAGMALGGKPAGSSKKGFGISLENNLEWREKLQKLNAKWFYTWGSELPQNIPAGIEFVPMIWGKWTCTDAVMQQLVAREHKTLLGFNEPDQHDQSNISVEEALSLWPILMESGMRLGSPAGVHPDGEWMAAFMAEVKKRGYRVDFITIHSYMGKNPQPFLNKMEKIQKLYNRPIWITEFAVADWNADESRPSRYSLEEVLGFMEVALPALEKVDYVERYAWFSSPNSPPAVASSVLFNEDGSLNALGKLYASL